MGAKGVKRKATAANKAAKLPVRAKSNEPAVSESAKGTMKVFDDDDDDAQGGQVVSTTLSSVEKPISREIPDSEGDESSADDDEAPEAVSTQNVASNAEQLAIAAGKAAQELAATQKRRRQERDALFKQQATSRKSKPTSAEIARSDSESDSPKLIKTKVPILLPEEFLTDESEPGSDAESFGHLDGPPKRRRVANVERTLTRLDHGPADERVGSTMFSVAKKETNSRLPPKMNKNAKHRKDALLKRKRVAVQPKGKFFKK